MKIGRYTVCGLLGRGGMGTVYKVRQPVTGKIAALKLLRPTDILEDLVGIETLTHHFIREARMMAALDHPNIATVLDCDEADGKPFFVMEYYCRNLGLLIGEQLRVEAPTRRLPLDQAVAYTLQTLDALARMHHAGIIHRDVKPFNIMLAGEGPKLQVKLIDFGLSRLRGDPRLAALLPSTETVTGEESNEQDMPAGIKIGSPYYAPPEQEAHPETVDERADCYPAAIMLYRMLTGILPNEEQTLADPSLGGAGNIPPASLYSDDLDEEWDHFFATALAADPQKRFADARTMRRELLQLFRQWEDRVANVCALPMDMEERPPASTTPVSMLPRTTPAKINVAQARQFFSLDALWRPQYTSQQNFAVNATTVTDSQHARMWQQSGSDYALTWEEAHDYITALNELRFAGYTDWRLPTVEECTLLLTAPPVLGDFCMPAVFNPEQEILWTCDRKSYMAAWFVSASLGFVGWQDFTCRFHVRAVRSL